MSAGQVVISLGRHGCLTAFHSNQTKNTCLNSCQLSYLFSDEFWLLCFCQAGLWPWIESNRLYAYQIQHTWYWKVRSKKNVKNGLRLPQMKASYISYLRTGKLLTTKAEYMERSSARAFSWMFTIRLHTSFISAFIILSIIHTEHPAKTYNSFRDNGVVAMTVTNSVIVHLLSLVQF